MKTATATTKATRAMKAAWSLRHSDSGLTMSAALLRAWKNVNGYTAPAAAPAPRALTAGDVYDTLKGINSTFYMNELKKEALETVESVAFFCKGTFGAQVAETVLKTRRASDKQLWAMAFAAVESGKWVA